MSPSDVANFSSTLAAIRALSIEDRIRLVEAVWDEIGADRVCPNLSEAQKRELDRRVADDDANPDDVIPWETIKIEARSRSKR
jgi:putative addiction module component (TIGR02574 family)